MNFVFAKIKRLKVAPLRKIVSDAELYTPVSVDQVTCIPFDHDHKLDDDSWFHIDEFSSTDMCPEFLLNGVSSVNLAMMNPGQFANMKWFCNVLNENYYFQNIVASSFLRAKSILRMGDSVVIDPAQERLLINAVPDGIYFPDADKLVFRRLSAIAGVFPEISVLFKEATNEDVRKILEMDCLELGPEFTLDKVSVPNRKRISALMQAWEEISEDVLKLKVQYVKNYCPDLEFNDETGKFNIVDDVAFKKFLHGLGDRYYTTEVGGERRLANSVSKLDS